MKTRAKLQVNKGNENESIQAINATMTGKRYVRTTSTCPWNYSSNSRRTCRSTFKRASWTAKRWVKNLEQPGSSTEPVSSLVVGERKSLHWQSLSFKRKYTFAYATLMLLLLLLLQHQRQRSRHYTSSYSAWATQTLIIVTASRWVHNTHRNALCSHVSNTAK